MVYTLLLFFVSFNWVIHADVNPFVQLLPKGFQELLEVPTSFTENINKELERLQKEKIALEEQVSNTKTKVERTQEDLAKVRQKVKETKGRECEFWRQKLVLITQKLQSFAELERTYQHAIQVLDMHSKLLREYQRDPEFTGKNLVLPTKSFYIFDDLQRVHGLLLQYDTELSVLQEKRKKTTLDLENRKKNQSLAQLEYEEKLKEQRDVTPGSADKSGFSVQHYGQLLDEQESLAQVKKQVADAQVLEVAYRLGLFEDQVKIMSLQYDIVRNEYTRVKHDIAVDTSDVEAKNTSLRTQLEEAAKVQQESNKHLNGLEVLKENELQQIAQYKQQYDLSDAAVAAMERWDYLPDSVDKWRAFIEIARLFDHIIYEIEVSKEKLLAQIDYEKTKVDEKETQALIASTWHKISSGILTHSSDELTREVKRYEKLKTDIQASLSTISDKRSNATSTLNANAQLAEGIKSYLQIFKSQKDKLFKNNALEYNRYAVQLKDEVDEDAPRRGEAIAQLIELYEKITVVRLSLIKKIDIMLEELKARRQWSCVQWPLLTGLQAFIPDTKKFITYVLDKNIQEIVQSYQTALQEKIDEYKKHPESLLPLLFKIIIVVLVFLLIKLYLPDIRNFLLLIGPEYKIWYRISSFAALIITFVSDHLLGLFIWALGFVAVHYNLLSDMYVGVLFYLISIIYLLWYAYLFVHYFKQINIQCNYVFTGKSYCYRLTILGSFVLYSTIVLLLLRQAFLLSPFAKSTVPTTLLALNYIIVQIAVISLFNRERILSLIPTTTPLWQWVHDHIQKYYYLFFISALALIIMSNPYVAYGPQFFWALSRIVLIILLIPLFGALHSKLKRALESFFFYSDTEVVQERFSHGRTVYGIVVIISFLVFVALGLLLAAYIWGYVISAHDIYALFDKELSEPIRDTVTGRLYKITVLNLAKVLLYMLGGMVLAYAINRFILRRMFDLLLVNIGVQSALLSLTRYVIIILAIVMGLQSIGLRSSLIYIFGTIAGLGIAGKEIITDLIGYFIILVQRPIKIGDFIRIDEEVNGVVRHITLRSVILRRKNSVTIIIPNSHVMVKPVINWNYSRTFFAFEDIRVTVPYTANPTFVKELMLKVLALNTQVLKNPAPIVQLRDFTDNGFLFIVRGFLSPDRTLEQFDIASDIRLEIVRVLRQHNISVASPTRLITIASDKKTEDTTTHTQEREQL